MRSLSRLDAHVTYLGVEGGRQDGIPLSRVSLAFSFFFCWVYFLYVPYHPPTHPSGWRQSFFPITLFFIFTALYAAVKDCGRVGLAFVFLRRQDRGFRSGRAGSGQMNRRFLFSLFLVSGLDWTGRTGRDWRGRGGLIRFGLCLCVRALLCVEGRVLVVR